MTTRELELIQRAEAAERAVIEAVRQRDVLLTACKETVKLMEWMTTCPAKRNFDAGLIDLRLALEKVNQ